MQLSDLTVLQESQSKMQMELQKINFRHWLRIQRHWKHIFIRWMDVFAKALKTAQEVAANENATDATIRNAYTELEMTKMTLVFDLAN